MGPATPARTTAISSPLSPGSSINLNISLTGRIDIERHRITSDGRVKLKLGLLGVAVDRCGICLSQFRGDDLAGLGSVCKHAFHQKCIKKWLDRNKTCPMCRVPLYVD
ncbi:hypothetical protein BDQ17DRAFT_1347587 [Cyathus striatus]|nr:hypothetical protein BDQ17DRAFT_1347587 [Cyathus striatus]